MTLPDGTYAIIYGASAATADERGKAVQVDPIKHTLKTPGTMRLKLKCD